MFVGIFKKYEDFIDKKLAGQGNSKCFAKAKFEEQLKKPYRPFVRQFTGTQMFQRFLEAKANPQKSEDEFVSRYFDEKIICKANRALFAIPKVGLKCM